MVSDETREYLRRIGRKGGLRGGPATAKSLSARQRKSNARRAATIRWDRERQRRTGTVGQQHP